MKITGSFHLVLPKNYWWKHEWNRRRGSAGTQLLFHRNVGQDGVLLCDRSQFFEELWEEDGSKDLGLIQRDGFGFGQRGILQDSSPVVVTAAAFIWGEEQEGLKTENWRNFVKKKSPDGAILSPSMNDLNQKLQSSKER